MLPTESLQGLGCAQCGGGITAQGFETGWPEERMCHRRGVGEGSRALVHLIDQFARALDFAQLPHRHGEDGHYHGAGVVGEAFARLLFALGVAGGERPLAMGPRLAEMAGSVAGQGEARRATPASTRRPTSSASFRNAEANPRARRSSPSVTAVTHWPWPAAKRSAKSLFAANSIMRAKASFVSSAAKPLDHITARPWA